MTTYICIRLYNSVAHCPRGTIYIIVSYI
ncbi:hypothetical protein KL86PLE_90602 [uncultured Pleomorphomonas sp.]|uniref:Uncharacterized protein n=1 Tax=uncultured Pleomorphomonas sp. TaxID=442121 RepID=A0A212LQD2_9HYPH|nr:hypothetical protein KL86PLE_90602 [uncultured Pleomorphomonas sp.]